MPIPIKVYQNPDNDHYVPLDTIDFSFLTTELEGISNGHKTVTASNNDADVLYEIWKQNESAGDNKVTLSKDSTATKDEIGRLCRMNLISANEEEVTFTERGKKVIMTMVLCEENAFAKNSQKKKYTEILASMNKKGKDGYRSCSNPKFASESANNLRLK